MKQFDYYLERKLLEVLPELYKDKMNTSTLLTLVSFANDNPEVVQEFLSVTEDVYRKLETESSATRSISKAIVEEFDLQEEESKDISNLCEEARDFVTGLKRLSRDTGYTITSLDLDCAALGRLDNGKLSNLELGVMTPRKLIYKKTMNRDDYKL